MKKWLIFFSIDKSYYLYENEENEEEAWEVHVTPIK